MKRRDAEEYGDAAGDKDGDEGREKTFKVDKGNFDCIEKEKKKKEWTM